MAQYLPVLAALLLPVVLFSGLLPVPNRWIIGAFALAVLIAGGVYLRATLRAWKFRRAVIANRDRVYGDIPLTTVYILMVAAGVAKAKGKIMVPEVETIQRIANNILQTSVTQFDVESYLNHASPIFDEREFFDIKEHIKGQKKYDIIRAAIEVMVADHHMHEAEKDYIDDLCQALDVTQTFFDSVWFDYVEDTKLIYGETTDQAMSG